MWTKREKVITDFKEANDYITGMYNFHDYVLGHMEVNNTEIKVTVEEDRNTKDNKNSLIWDFAFNGFSSLKFNIDCYCKSYIYEIEIKDNSNINISLSNGYINFKTKGITLGIPKRIE